jgi:hypothetical protein
MTTDPDESLQPQDEDGDGDGGTEMKILIITINPAYNQMCLEVAQHLLSQGSSITLAKEEELVWLDFDDYDHILKDPSMDIIHSLLKGNFNGQS